MPYYPPASSGGSGDMTKATYDAANVNEQLVGLTAAQVLSSKTLTSPVINTGVSGTAIDTDGTLAGNSDTKLASQKATKTYADTGDALKLAKASNLSDVGNAATSFGNIKQNATTSATGVVQLTNDLGGTATAPTVPALGNVVKYNFITAFGHSYLVGTTQTDSGTPFVYLYGTLSKIMGLLNVQDDNVKILAQAGSRITSSVNPITADALAGWAAVWQMELPNNNVNINATTDTVITDPIIAGGGAKFIVHGVNDFALGTTGTAAIDAQATTNTNNAAQNAYRAVISRMRSGVVFGSTVVAGSINWDSSFSFSGGSDVASVTQNTGPAYKSFNTIGNAVTHTVSTNFTGGTIVFNFAGQANGVTFLSGNGGSITSGASSMKVSANTDFPSSGTLVINIAAEGSNTREEVLVTSGLGSNTWNITRGVNGTAASAHADNAVISVATDAHKVNWTTSATSGAGLFTSVTGSSSLSGQGTANQKVALSKRFTAIAADGGQTITATVANIVTGDTSAIVQFDSVQYEAPNPPPIVYTNLAHWSYGGTTTRNELIIAAWNTAITSVAAEFDSWVQVADVYTPFFNRNGTTTVAVPASGDSGTSTGITATTLTDTTKGWAINALVGSTITTNGKTMVVTSNTATVLTGASWTGGTPSVTTYTVTGTAASVPWTANSSSFTPTVGMRFSFGRLSGEHVDITAVSGSYPNWVLGFKRAVGGTSAGAHSTNNFLGPMQWVHTDDVHITDDGHSVFAETIYNAFKAMPTPSTYQTAENQGNFSQLSRNFSMGLVDNGYMYPSVLNMGTGNAAINTLTFHPLLIPKICAITEIGVATTAVNASPSTLRFGIWYPDQTHAKPGRLIQELGTVASAIATNNGLTGTYQILNPGYYWVGVVQQGGGAASTLRTISTLGLGWPILMSSSTLGANSMIGYSMGGVSGSLGDASSLSDQTTNGNVARIYVRVRSINFS